jgi:hypothetical protein
LYCFFWETFVIVRHSWLRIGAPLAIVLGALAVASCGGGSNSTPAGPAPVTSSAAVPSSAGSFTAPAINGLAATFNVAAGAPAGTTVTMTSSVTAPSGILAPSAIERQTQSIGGAVPFLYVSISLSQAVSTSFFTSELLALTSSLPSTASYYLEIDDPSEAPPKLTTIAGTLTSGTATFTNSGGSGNGTQTLAANHTYVFQFYYIPAGTPTPSPSPSPSATPTANPAFITLGSAGTYAVLASQTVTAAGPVTITGNLGIWPGTSLTGFPPATITGTSNVGNTAAQLAEGALTTAYNAALAEAGSPAAVAGNIGGQTLTPGLYKSTSSLAISSGNLTLSGNGDPNAVFVFQIASTLTTTTGSSVILTNGANAANVFWQIGSSATLGGTPFMGNVLALTSITIGNGVAMTGRALCQNGAVSLGTSGSVTIPTATANGQGLLRYP